MLSKNEIIRIKIELLKAFNNFERLGTISDQIDKLLIIFNEFGVTVHTHKNYYNDAMKIRNIFDFNLITKNIDDNEKLLHLYYYFVSDSFPKPAKTNAVKFNEYWYKANSIVNIDIVSAIVYQRKALESYISEKLNIFEYNSLGGLIKEFNIKFPNKTLNKLSKNYAINNYLNDPCHTFAIDLHQKWQLSDYLDFFIIFNELINEVDGITNTLCDTFENKFSNKARKEAKNVKKN